MAAIGRGDTRQAPGFADRDHGRVNEPEVGILAIQIGDPRIALAGKIRDGITTRS